MPCKNPRLSTLLFSVNFSRNKRNVLRRGSVSSWSNGVDHPTRFSTVPVHLAGEGVSDGSSPRGTLPGKNKKAALSKDRATSKTKSKFIISTWPSATLKTSSSYRSAGSVRELRLLNRGIPTDKLYYTTLGIKWQHFTHVYMTLFSKSFIFSQKNFKPDFKT